MKIGSKLGEHQLGMVSGKSRLMDRSFSVGIQSCKEDGRFDLGGGYRRIVVDSVKIHATVDLKWGTVISAETFDLCAHHGKRVDDPSHRSGI